MACTSDIPSTMKAVIQTDPHSHELIMSEVPVPVPTHPEDVLVRVHTTSPCAGELDWAAAFPQMFPKDRVAIPGQDMAGTVAAAPAGSRFKAGDQVYARIEAVRPGAAAEFTLARESELAHKPAGLDWTQAAAVALSALTAYQGLFVQGSLDAAALHGDGAARAKNQELRVLVTAASGGVGSCAVQLARAAGAGAIVASCGPRNVDFVRALGAMEVVDYTRQDLAAWAQVDPSRRCDLILDCVGGPTLEQSWRAVVEGGSLISICGPPEQAKPSDVAVSARSLFFIVRPLGSDLEVIAGLIEAGVCKPVVDSVFDFNDFAKAFGRVEGGHARGKIIIQVDAKL